MTEMPTIAAVIIGRNEGERLVRCLASVGGVARIVYVDSGSTDGSVANARAAGAEVVELDLSRPFTAARARNAGVDALRDGPLPELIQFIDGDCELQPGWLATAKAFLDDHPEAGVACGRRRERFPEASVYNRLCDAEWNTPIGRATSCGGDSLMRLAVFDEAGGFNPAQIAGEEPELCVRLRRKGWEIWRLDAEMTLHDAAMTRFSQWWKRERRGGYAYALRMERHGAPPERDGVKGVRRALFWGLALPAVALLGTLATPWSLLLFLAYPLQFLRQAVRQRGAARWWEGAFFDIASKFPQALGCLTHLVHRLSRKQARLIEYK